MTDDVQKLGAAIERLREFARTFNAGEPVDEESGLMADDLFVLVDLLESLHALAASAPPE